MEGYGVPSMCASYAFCHLIPQPPCDIDINLSITVSEMRKLGLQEIMLVA